MKLHNLKPAEGSVKSTRRIGRGEGSGKGGTSTRGHKGQKSRSGYSKKFGFEGGQMPLNRRVPKVGFKNPNRVEYQAVNVDTLQRISEEQKIKSFDLESLKKFGAISTLRKPVKILGRGELSASLEVKAHAFTKKAQEVIEEKGGKVELI